MHQILHFMLKDEMNYDAAIRMVDLEVAQYKQRLDRSGISYKILREDRQSDGSMILEIKKQYNTSPVGDFLA